MDAVNAYYAKAHLSKLLERVVAGEEVVITRDGLPFTKAPRRPGSLRGRVRIADDFDAPLPEELLRAFSGELVPAKPDGSP